MAHMLRVEFTKVFYNWLFVITLIVAAAIAIWSGISAIMLYAHDREMVAVSAGLAGVAVNPDYGLITLFNKWIGQDYVAMATSLFYLLLPILSVLPYAWSYYSERKSGYVKQVLIRTHRSTYFLSKYIATFVSGALVILIPMALNFMLVSAFIPAAKPDLFYDIYYGMPAGAKGSVLFYEHPYWFVLCRFLMAGVFAGLIATCVIALSFFINNRFVVMLVPFLVLLTINYFSGMTGKYTGDIELSPINFIHGGSVNFPKLWVLLLYVAVLFLFSFGIILWRGRKSDVY